jgi:hypothetical protein
MSLYFTVQCCAIVQCMHCAILCSTAPNILSLSCSCISSVYIIQSDFMIGKFLTPPTPYTYYPPSKLGASLHVTIFYSFSCSSSSSSSSCDYSFSLLVHLFLLLLLINPDPPLPLSTSSTALFISPTYPTPPVPFPFSTTPCFPFLLPVSLS